MWPFPHPYWYCKSSTDSMFRVIPLLYQMKIMYAFESNLKAKFIQFKDCVSYSEAHTHSYSY